MLLSDSPLVVENVRTWNHPLAVIGEPIQQKIAFHKRAVPVVHIRQNHVTIIAIISHVRL